MKYTRYFLYGALLVVCLSLWNAWQREYPPAPAPAVTAAALSIPSAVAQQPHPAVLSGSVKPSALPFPKKGKIIHIKTDVLNVDINTLGGNIVKVTLPKYPQKLHSDKPYLLLNVNPNTFYVVQSGFSTANDKDIQQLDYRVVLDSAVKPQNDTSQSAVILKAKNKEGLSVTKTFTFKPNSYAVGIAYTLHNPTSKTWQGSYTMRLMRMNIPPLKKGFLHMGSFFGAAIWSPEEKYKSFAFKKLAENPIQKNIKSGWAAIVQHYFVSAWRPDLANTYHYYSQANPNGIYTIGLTDPSVTVQPNQSISKTVKFYAGPKLAKRLNNFAPHLSLAIHYGILWPIAIPILELMKFIFGFIGNWGWSIIIVTIIIKVLFYKLSETTYKSMAASRKLQPKIKQLKERYGSDKQGMSKALMELYKKEKANPLMGCLPTLIQIPVFIALYYVLLESVELRQAPFIFWIHDLSVKDPYYVLPILMGITYYFIQKLSPTSPDPTQAKVMALLPVIMTVFFLWFPAGLVLYWVVNNLLSLLQQWYITQKYEHGGYQTSKVKSSGQKKRSYGKRKR